MILPKTDSLAHQLIGIPSMYQVVPPDGYEDWDTYDFAVPNIGVTGAYPIHTPVKCSTNPLGLQDSLFRPLDTAPNVIVHDNGLLDDEHLVAFRFTYDGVSLVMCTTKDWADRLGQAVSSWYTTPVAKHLTTAALRTAVENGDRYVGPCDLDATYAPSKGVRDLSGLSSITELDLTNSDVDDISNLRMVRILTLGPKITKLPLELSVEALHTGDHVPLKRIPPLEAEYLCIGEVALTSVSERFRGQVELRKTDGSTDHTRKSVGEVIYILDHFWETPLEILLGNLEPEHLMCKAILAERINGVDR